MTNDEARDSLDQMNANRYGMSLEAFRAWTGAVMALHRRPIKPRSGLIHWLRKKVRF